MTKSATHLANEFTNISPLKQAVLDGNVDLLHNLIAQGVDVPLYKSNLLTRQNIKNVARLLVKGGAGGNVSFPFGQTPLIFAARNSNEEVAKLLIENGADANVSDKDGKTPLFSAAKNNNKEVAKLLIENGADVNVSDKDGKTPLFSAAKNNKEVAKLLIEKGADVNVSDKHWITPLFFSAKNNNEEVARLLVEKGADVNVCDKDGKTPLFNASVNKNEEVAKLLIENGADVNVSDRFGQNPLFFAANNTNEEVSRLLIEKGSDVNVSDKDGKTPLFVAAMNNNKEVARLLIEKGADVNASDKDGKNPLFVAAKYNNEEVALLLIERGADVNVSDKDGRTLLFFSANDNNEDVSRLLVQKGADVNVSDKDGKTPLFFAAKNINKKVAQLLIEKGADANVSDKYGQTPLFNASRNENEGIVRLLIEKGANVNVSDKDGKSPLLSAAKNNNKEVLKLLIENGANVNASDKSSGQTPLLFAAENNNKEVAKLLIEKGADVNVSKKDGKSSLFFAANNNNNEVARLLIENGADVNASDKYGKSPLFSAADNNNKEVAKLLIEKGADVNASDKDGKSPLFSAADNNNKEVAKLLIESGAIVNTPDKYGQTALFHCISKMREFNGVALFVQILLDFGADANISDNKGQTPLFYALTPSAIGLLLEHGADCGVRNNEQETVLIHAIKHNVYMPEDLDYFSRNIDCIRTLVSCGEFELEARDIYGRTAILYAVLFSDTIERFNAIARILIDKGADLNATDNNGGSVLAYFIEKYCSSYWRSKDADYFYDDLENDENADYPSLFRDGFVYDLESDEDWDNPFLFEDKVFKENGIDDSIIFHSALNYLYLNLPNYLHSANAVIQEKGKAIFLNVVAVASQYASDPELTCIENLKTLLDDDRITEALQVLKMLGVNPNSADSYGNTALHYATLLPFHGVSQECVMKILETLEKHRVRFNVKNQEMETPLHFCISRKALELASKNETWSGIMALGEVCEFLLKDGSLIIETTRSGESVHHLITKLMQKGLSMDDREIREVICLHAVKVLELFSKTTGEQSLINFSVINKDGESPLHLLASLSLPPTQNYEDLITKDFSFHMLLDTILKFLLKPGVTPNQRNADDQTPLHLCKTWTAAQILLKAGAYANDIDIDKRPPMLNIAKQHLFVKDSSSQFFPDVHEGQKELFEECISSGFDIWSADKHGESILSILLKNEMFELSSALIEVACDRDLSRSVVKQIVETICKDESTHSNWKSSLIAKILASKSCFTHDLDHALLCCCNNINALHDQGKAVDFEGGDTCVHVDIARQLRLYGADGNKYTHCYNEFPQLRSFLTTAIDLDNVPMSIPWTSQSKKHAEKLARVARKQNVQEMSTFAFHENPIGHGLFGHVFAGINKKDGREIAIKKIEKLRMVRPEDIREIRNLTALADCPKVVRYIFFHADDKDFVYIVLELMEGHLDDYFASSSYDVHQSGLLCKDLVEGLTYLHQHKPKPILHRDLKPGNILYKVHPQLCLKIADFGLSSPLETGDTTVFGTNVGTRCWMAPEVMLSETNQHSRQSDIFSSGLLLHYILSNQKHPFSPSGCTSKFSELNVHQTQGNLLNYQMEGWNDALSPEATHLIKGMLQQDDRQRPSAADSLSHPFFWSNQKKKEFLRAVGNQAEIACRLACGPLNACESDLEEARPRIFSHGDWNHANYTQTSAIYTYMTIGPRARKNYDTRSVSDLVRFIRNALGHVSEFCGPKHLQKQILDGVFMEEFPDLLMEVYKAVVKYGRTSREEIKKVLQDY